MSEATVRKAGQGNSDWICQRRRPEQTLLYRFVEEHYPCLPGPLASQCRSLPEHVQHEVENFFKCSRLECGFPRVRCVDCQKSVAVEPRTPHYTVGTRMAL